MNLLPAISLRGKSKSKSRESLIVYCFFATLSETFCFLMLFLMPYTFRHYWTLHKHLNKVRKSLYVKNYAEQSSVDTFYLTVNCREKKREKERDELWKKLGELEIERRNTLTGSSNNAVPATNTPTTRARPWAGRIYFFLLYFFSFISVFKIIQFRIFICAMILDA